jgi:hypothetical protein
METLRNTPDSVSVATSSRASRRQIRIEPLPSTMNAASSHRS